MTPPEPPKPARSPTVDERFLAAIHWLIVTAWSTKETVGWWIYDLREHRQQLPVIGTIALVLAIVLIGLAAAALSFQGGYVVCTLLAIGSTSCSLVAYGCRRLGQHFDNEGAP